jgi:valyl-tRNA synthetase
MAGRDRKALEERTRYDPSEVEPRVLSQWLEAGIFHPDATGTPEDNFSIAIPPPNVTGELHMGHALNGTLQDVLTRMRRMEGRNTLWALGTDHAGIATQVVVERQLAREGTTREELGRDLFERRVWEWREQYGSKIVEQYKRLGASCDYERERFTMDDRYVRAVLKVFKSLYDKGLIYRDYYMVNWDPGSETAISDLEVEHREVEDTLYYIDYPLESGDDAGGGNGRQTHITVATVRPETMLADVAVAVNPNDERYSGLIGKAAILPIVGRRLPIIADDFVDPEFGTGALKITPGHDPNDFDIGRRHGLEEISVIGEDGRMNEAAGERFAGLTVSEARVAVVEALEELGAISRREDYVHSVGFSHRSGVQIEPLISLQWFLSMDELAKPAIEAVESERVRIVPSDPWKRVLLDWMRNLRPWCISRQLWWGHRIPVWYCDACEETYVAESPPERCGTCDAVVRQEEDVLDTWFSSQLWPFAVLGWPDDTPELRAFYPTDFLTTAREILYLWVARMIMMGLEFMGEVPFDDVYVHSVILAPDGRRMSKSLGTGIDPVEAISEHGADALRFGLAAMSSSQDVSYSLARVEQGRDLANKLWNASRLVLMNTEDSTAAPALETVEDRWIVSRLQRVIADITRRNNAYEFSHTALDLYAFVWSEFCDWYLEIVKPRLYEGASATVSHVLGQTLGLLHPLMPFVTEEIHGFMPGREGLLAVQRFPVADDSLIDEVAEREAGAAMDAIQSLRRYREEIGIAAGERIPGRLIPETPEFTAIYERWLPTIGRLARVDLVVAEPDGALGEATLKVPGATIALEADAEGARERRREQVGKEIERAEGKLANTGFVAKAPPELVQQERDKLERYRRELDELDG